MKRALPVSGGWVPAAVATVAVVAVAVFPRATPEEALLRRWLNAQARGTIPAALFREVEAAPLSLRAVAARKIGEPESPVTTGWRRLRPRLPDAVRARVPLPFSAGRRGVALLNLVSGFEHEPAVCQALLAVVTNREATNRRIALLALGRLPVLPPELAEPLSTVADAADHRLRLDVATMLQLATPRTGPVTLALQRLSRDPVPGVRQAANPTDPEVPEIATP
jgi:hypothetical protein